MTISVKKYSPTYLEKAKQQKLALFKWEMDKRFVDDPNDRICIQMIGTMTAEKATRIFQIINERPASD